MAKITKDMLLVDVLEQGNPDELTDILLSFGMHCIGCALAHGETVEEAALVHGIDVNELLDALNKAVNN